ncbi:class I adenylate-forming enzyme family protein [Sciscionella marina]|uniref:class I adenylate-forming enzyme family protein n=1 Tax=Sciscionella marina TaxID=508770 RepID=UPI00146A3555|nr:AMP-binding protein [Sciscionella marina]
MDTAAAPPWSALNVTHLVERTGRDPARTAVVCAGQSRTYGQLRDRYRRVANGLVGRGIDRMDRVGLATTNRLEYFEVEFGISGAAAIMVALSFRLADAERINLLARSGARAVFAEHTYVPALAAARASGQLPELELIVSFGTVDGADVEYEQLCAEASGERPAVSPPAFDDPHEIIYTSGTTSAPKGVIWSHGTVMWNSIQQVMDFNLRSDHTTYVQLDLNYIGGRHDFTFAVLHQGGTVHLRRSGGFNAAEALHYVCEHRISHVLWVPTMLYDVLRVPELKQLNTSTLEMIMCGGAPLSKESVLDAQRAFPHTRFVQVFGLTEGGGTTTVVPPDSLSTKIGSAGKASMHNEIRIADDVGDALPSGQIGEILIRGPAVTVGYWGDPQATAETVVDGWLHTGDLGYLDDEDFLYVAGRKKDMIITGGMNVYPSDVEGVVRQHPAVADVSVIGVPDEKWGERVCAVIQPLTEVTVDTEAIMAFCKERLASFKKPTVVYTVDELPRTLSGKVKKYLLRDRFANSTASGNHP